jgi:hypothetical protein
MTSAASARSAFDKGGVRRTRLGGGCTEPRHRFSSFRETPLRVAEPRLHLPLFLFELCDRPSPRPHARDQSVALLFRPTTFEGDDIGLSRQARRIVGHTCDLRLDPDDLFLQTMLLCLKSLLSLADVVTIVRSRRDRSSRAMERAGRSTSMR